MASFISTFFAEKDLPFVQWDLTADDGSLAIISNEVVIEFLKNNPALAKQAEPTLRKLDFFNADINDFLKHIAGFIINQKQN